MQRDYSPISTNRNQVYKIQPKHHNLPERKPTSQGNNAYKTKHCKTTEQRTLESKPLPYFSQ
jgi:hypothetical protein